MPKGRKYKRRSSRRYRKKGYSSQVKGFNKPTATGQISRSYLSGSAVWDLPSTLDSPDFYYRGMSTLFKITNSPSASVFLKYYRFYRIVGVQIRVGNDQPDITASYNDASDVTDQYSQLSICVVPDREGSTEVCTSEAEFQYLMANRTKKIRHLNPGQTMICAMRPNILGVTYESLTNSGYTPLYNKWIRNDDTSVPHYGFRLGVKYKSRRTFSLRVQANMIVQFKEPCIDSKFSLTNDVDATAWAFDHSAEDDSVTPAEHSADGAVLVTDDDDEIETDQHIGNAPSAGD